MPRPEKPLDPEGGPIVEFARDLRQLRADAGNPTYRTMAIRCHYGYTTLSEAALGRRFPNWGVARAYVSACDGNLTEWEQRWRETAAVLSRPGAESDDNGERSPPRGAATRTGRQDGRLVTTLAPAQASSLPELMRMLDELRRRSGLSLRGLSDRSREGADGTTVVLARTTVSEFLRGERLPRIQDVERIVELCRRSPAEINVWSEACSRLLTMHLEPFSQTRLGLPAQVTGEPGGDLTKPSGTGPTALRMILGARLRRLREAKGISTERAGEAIRSSGSKISRLELGRVGFKQRDVDDLLELYGVTSENERARMLELARECSAPGWWQGYSDIVPSWFQAYLGLEEAASVIRTYEARLIPGLLQTEDYARAVIRQQYGNASEQEEEVNRRVAIQMTRRERLESRGAKLWAIVEEAALRRFPADQADLRGQIENLIAVSKLPNVSLQIMPLKASSPTMIAGSFTILRFSRAALTDVIYLEQLTRADFIEKPVEAEIYRRQMDYLAAACLPPSESIDLLESMQHSMTSRVSNSA